jgi:hypothetical protein
MIQYSREGSRDLIKTGTTEELQGRNPPGGLRRGPN